MAPKTLPLDRAYIEQCRGTWSELHTRRARLHGKGSTAALETCIARSRCLWLIGYQLDDASSVLSQGKELAEPRLQYREMLI